MNRRTNITHEAGAGKVVLTLTVRNHPGVMSHVCGLFARRAFNVEAILCLPEGDGAQSRVWLLVEGDERLSQMVSQTLKLEDVLSVDCTDPDGSVFEKLETLFADRQSR